MTADFVGIADLMARWSYTRQGIHKLARHPDFPPSAFTINRGRTRVWRLADLEPFERDRPELHDEVAKLSKVRGYYRAIQKGGL